MFYVTILTTRFWRQWSSKTEKKTTVVSSLDYIIELHSAYEFFWAKISKHSLLALILHTVCIGKWHSKKVQEFDVAKANAIHEMGILDSCLMNDLFLIVNLKYFVLKEHFIYHIEISYIIISQDHTYPPPIHIQIN